MDLGTCRACGDFEGRCRCGKGRILLSYDKRVAVSKFLSGLLRHYAKKFGVKVDEHGWADLSEVTKIVREKYGVGRKAIELIVKFDEKGRFEIRNGRIRARYGHSIDVVTDWSESDAIPDKLYHATPAKNLRSIMKYGLLPMKRKEVHMCETQHEAIEVGRRHCSDPVLLEIDAKKAVASGISIRKKGKVYTADRIPPEFIKVL